MPTTDVPPGTYRHWKGNLYVVVGKATHHDGAPYVLYRPIDTQEMFVRPASMWFDEMPNGKVRFQRADDH